VRPDAGHRHDRFNWDFDTNCSSLKELISGSRQGDQEANEFWRYAHYDY